MKKVKEVILALVLALSMVVPVTAVNAAMTAEEELLLLPVRAIFEADGAVVTWNRADSSIHIAIADGTIVMHPGSTKVYVNDTVAHLQYAIILNEGVSLIYANDLNLLAEIFFATLPEGPVGASYDVIIPYVTPVERTTDHGEMAADFIEIINDTLYSRVPFTYRELEAAEWLAYQLVAMGHSADAVKIQSFSIDDVNHQMQQFGWSRETFDALNLFGDGPRLGTEEASEFFFEMLYDILVAQLETLGIPYEMAGAALGGMDVVDFVNIVALPARMEQMMSYGLFNEDVQFRPYSQNVILTIPGQSEQKIVITAHKDTLDVPGASDNASGMGLLLESAYRMLDADNYYTIVYAFVGAEEVGLAGVYYFYNSLTAAGQSNIVLNINADVLFEGPYFFFGTAQLADDELVSNAITLLIAEIAEQVNATYGTQLIGWYELAAMPSDQLVFLYEGHTVVAFTGLARTGSAAYAAFDGPTMVLIGGAGFGASVVHTHYDNVHFINEAWPEKIADAMWTFSLMLEALLDTRFPAV